MTKLGMCGSLHAVEYWKGFDGVEGPIRLRQGFGEQVRPRQGRLPEELRRLVCQRDQCSVQRYLRLVEPDGFARNSDNPIKVGGKAGLVTAW